MLSDVGFKDGEDFFLLVARQARDLFEEALGLSDRTGAALLAGSFADEEVGGDGEGVGQGEELFGPEGDGLALPMSDGALRGVESLCELFLGEAGLLAGGGQAFPEGSSLPLSWSSGWHVVRVTVGEGNIRLILHD